MMPIRKRVTESWRGLLACSLLILGVAGWLAPPTAAAAGTGRVFSVRAYGAVGDGKALDTAAINKAIAACAAAGGGRVVFPAGTYLSGTVLLKSNITMHLEAGARLLGTPDLTQYQSFQPPTEAPEAHFGKNWNRALVLGIGAENVAITGPGIIDGNKVYDPQGEEKMRGPHGILLGQCRNVALRGVTVKDAANYGLMIEFGENFEVSKAHFVGGWDGVHFRSLKDRPCRNIKVEDCRFETGDDSIAGRYVDGLLVRNCSINSSCNGVRIIGPVKNMLLENCTFYGPGRQPHRSSKRTNMLSGIILQPGAWDACAGPMEDVRITSVSMKNVASPVTIWIRRPGNTIDRVTIDHLSATGVYRAAASVESWSPTPVGRITFRDVSISYDGGGAAGGPELRAPRVDARLLPAWGFYARGVERLSLENVRLSCVKSDARPLGVALDVRQLDVDGCNFGKDAFLKLQ